MGQDRDAASEAPPGSCLLVAKARGAFLRGQAGNCCGIGELLLALGRRAEPGWGGVIGWRWPGPWSGSDHVLSQTSGAQLCFLSSLVSGVTPGAPTVIVFGESVVARATS